MFFHIWNYHIGYVKWPPQLTLNDSFSKVERRLRTSMGIHFETRQIIVLPITTDRYQKQCISFIETDLLWHKTPNCTAWVLDILFVFISRRMFLSFEQKRPFLGQKYTLVFKNRLSNKWHFITKTLSRGLEPSVGMCFWGKHGNAKIAVSFITLYFIYSLTYKSTSRLVA